MLALVPAGGRRGLDLLRQQHSPLAPVNVAQYRQTRDTYTVVPRTESLLRSAGGGTQHAPARATYTYLINSATFFVLHVHIFITYFACRRKMQQFIES